MNINVSLVFKTSLFLGISDYIRWPIVFPAETLSQASSQLDATCNSALLCHHCNVRSPCLDRKCCALQLRLPSFRPEAYFKSLISLVSQSILGYLISDGIAEGADVGVLLRCATKSGLGVGVRRLGEFRADDSYLPRLYR